jgi:mannitol 2-dehydrogenase
VYLGQDISSLQRLSGDQLHNLHADIKVPTYDRSAVKTGIVHIGPSAFFRGHLAVYVDDLLQQGETDWGICAVSLKSSGVRDALKDQDNLFTVVEQSNQGNKARVIGSINEVLVAKEGPQAVLDQMAAPDTKLVTLTVTQSGYYYKNGQLDFDDDDIKADLLKADEPTSTVGYIVKALEMRMERGLPAFTVMSCDNLPGNGTILRNVVLTYAKKRSQGLHDWIEKNVEFPSTMVDRIVPKTTADHITRHAQTYSLDDSWPIYTEKFRQFVIENPKNGAPMPDFADVGALQVDDVAPFELMKICLLNGIHMALGIAGRMTGYKYAHEAIADPKIRTYVTGLMDEMTATLHPVPGVDLEQYKATIFDRLGSPFMNDELARLARNGVDKIDSRFLQPLREAISRKSGSNNLIFAVASWAEYLKRSAQRRACEPHQRRINRH